MTLRGSGPYRNVVFLGAALDDLRRVAARSPEVAREVLRTLKRLDAGTERPRPLNDFAKTGDLTDCGKFVVLVEGQPEHRIVVCDRGGRFEVSEVIAVEAREGDLPYLLAGLRLGRLTDPIRRSDAQRRVARIQRLLESEPTEER